MWYTAGLFLLIGFWLGYRGPRYLQRLKLAYRKYKMGICFHYESKNPLCNYGHLDGCIWNALCSNGVVG